MPGEFTETIRPTVPPVLGGRVLPATVPPALRVVFWIVSISLALFVFGAFLLPGKVRVEREIVIKALPAQVLARLESLKQWEAWGPWFQRDPFMKKDFSGPDYGVGAMLAWKSKNDGEGKVKIVSVMPSGTVRAAVDFGENGEADISFFVTETTFLATRVKLRFETDFGTNMARRYFGLLLPKVIGKDLDEGLANLKQLLEKPAAAP